MSAKKRIHSFEHLRVEAEIEQLHQFFQDWYNGDIPHTGDVFERLENALAEGFRLITPGAQIIERASILAVIKKDRNSRMAMRIWIEDVNIQHGFEEHVLATYQEWQQRDGQTTVRLSSVLFRSNPELPNGFAWIYVHETWLDPTE
jgi:hypothetical protein